jgi:hypothetical protein
MDELCAGTALEGVGDAAASAFESGRGKLTASPATVDDGSRRLFPSSSSSTGKQSRPTKKGAEAGLRWADIIMMRQLPDRASSSAWAVDADVMK